MTETLIVLLERALVGRIVLSFLPPGELGGHEPRAWPTTWAASHLLGGVLLEAVRAWTALAGWHVGAGAGAGFVALALIVRWLAAPGAMVPRHAPAFERAGLATWVLRAAWIGVVLARGLSALVVADLVAAGVFVELALALARRRPWTRAAVVLVWIATMVSGSAADVVLAAAAAGAGWIAWRRRADARSLVLVAIGLASASLREPWLAATAALVVFGYTEAPVRKRAALACVLAALAIATPHAHGWERGSASLARATRSTFDAALGSWRAQSFWLLVAVALLAAVLGVAGASRAPRGRRAVDPPERELAALALWVVLAPLVAIGVARFVGPWEPARSESFLAALAAFAAILVGLVVCPDERVERPEPA